MKFKAGFFTGFFIVIFFGYSIYHWIAGKETTFLSFIALLLLFGLVVYLLITFLRYGNFFSTQTAQNFKVFTFSLLSMLFLCETGLRLFDKNLQSYMERNGAWHYSSAFRVYLLPCNSCGPGYFYINPPGGTEEFSKSEFHYLHRYNSLGLRDREFTTQKDTAEFRIIGIGDSFTEGVGAPADSSWLKQLEYLLNAGAAKPHYTTLNGGAHGSDLIFAYDLLNKCLLKYKPDLVILNLNSTDIGDIVSRGVEERKYDNKNCIEGRGPWWEFLFGSSYIVRLIAENGFHLNWQLMSHQKEEQENDYALHAIANQLALYQQLAQKEHFKFLLIIQPLQNELANNNLLSRLQIDTAIKRIDLTPVLSQKINTLHEPASKYYWPVDGHFTSTGYGLEARTIYDSYFAHP